jgi:putative transposase
LKISSTVTIAKIAEATGKHKTTIARTLAKIGCSYELERCESGQEKHLIVSTLPDDWQLDLYRKAIQEDNIKKASTSDSKQTDKEEQESEELWKAFDKKTDIAKEEAGKRVKAIHEVIALTQSGYNKGDAQKEIAKQLDCSPESIRTWMRKVKGYHTADWLSLLASRYTGRQKTAAISPEAWEFFKVDYLRLESPAASAVYRRLEQASEGRDWQFPSLKTIQRKIKREILPQVIILARQGVESLMAAYPAQQRDRSFVCFR